MRAKRRPTIVYTTHPWRPLSELRQKWEYIKECGNPTSCDKNENISKKVGILPVVEGDIDCLLGKSVVRKAWVSGETIGSWLATIQKGDSLGGNSTYVMEDRLCHTIEEETSADTTSEEHWKPGKAMRWYLFGPVHGHIQKIRSVKEEKIPRSVVVLRSAALRSQSNTAILAVQDNIW